MDREIRQLHIENIETRALDNGNMQVDGYIATFNSKSKYMGFYETIDPHAFDSTLTDGHNIFMLYNHDWDKPLADTETGSLQLSVDNIGLRFSVILDKNISYANDVYNLVKSGLIKGCSFGFITNKDTWTTNENMEDIRTLLNVTLLEVTLTIAPAYNETSASASASASVSVRSYDKYKQSINDAEKAKQEQRELELLRIELELD